MTEATGTERIVIGSQRAKVNGVEVIIEYFGYEAGEDGPKMMAMRVDQLRREGHEVLNKSIALDTTCETGPIWTGWIHYLRSSRNHERQPVTSRHSIGIEREVSPFSDRATEDRWWQGSGLRLGERRY